MIKKEIFINFGKNVNGIMKINMLFILFLLFVIGITSVFACNPQWIKDVNLCNTTDQAIVTYTDLNNCNSSNVPIANGTTESCNYCYQDLEQIETPCINSTQNLYWTDNNFYSCCDITNLASDCDILTYPFNLTINQSCYYGTLYNELGNLSCQRQANMGVKDKEYCIAHIPLNYSNETFKCIAMIRDGNTGEIIQTTPQYRETSQTFFNINPDADTRQYFSPANSIVNFYYTGKNLNPDKHYILSIECSSNLRTLKSEMMFDIAYEDVSFVFFRTKWLMANSSYIVGGLIVLFILLVILFAIIKGAFR